MAPLLRNALPEDALRHARPQIQDLSTENIAELAVRARELGGVIPLWYGEGDLTTPEFVRDAAKAAFDEGMTFYIPDMRGYPPLTAALSEYQTRLHGRAIAPERSTVTPSGMQALLMAMELVADVGTNIVYVEPQWPNIRNVIHLVGAEPRPVALDLVDNDFRLDLDKLFARCDARTRAILFSTPANPTGWVCSREEFEALLEFSRKRGIWIISDEVYNRLYFREPFVAPSILSLAEPEDLALSVNSFSKGWAMTGWRVGWLTHPASVAPQIAQMTQLMNSGTAGPVQAGALAALTKGEGLVTTMRERCRAGIDLAYGILSKNPTFQLPEKPRGGMYVFFSLPGTPNSREACMKILESSRVGLAPGSMFGQSSTSFVRMCVCRDPVQLEAALERMAHALK
ncbi:pyridoxal phosphate-dependent aminotransferase [Alsobacter sp. SYSU M60028]|uniref:Aminotransferase n=1 Tax=Alsobacter ponti TaxID=2962936 RepID=A0ABT1LA92_9HYPH|nr:pyridoxal phosphate-dependent aminotransferase [Alsobacter ponti]MCP8937978.1 pyridoxal phosphate-dependent aminotransferase [Alsobacter ponti]